MFWGKRARDFWADAAGPIVVLIGVAISEQLLAVHPRLPEPGILILVATAIAGFYRGLKSAVLSSLIAVAYALVFVAGRHESHGTNTDFCYEAIFLAAASPALAIMGGLLRQHANRTVDILKKHLSNTPLGVIELFGDYEVRLWAGAAETIFGIKSANAVGKNLFDLPTVFFSEDDAEQVESLLVELKNGFRTRAVHHMRSATEAGEPGHSRWFWSSALDAKGKGAGFLVLVEDITERVLAEQELENSKTEIIRRLVRAAEYRDDDTGLHVVRMARYCEALGRAVGLDERDSALLLTAAPMHDIGKIGVPDRILLKGGPLTEDELEVIKGHTLIGADLMSGSKHELIQCAETIALTHHENWDGTGYPRGLKGEEIPLMGRICAVCDTFDALVSCRPYKAAWTVEEAWAELKQMSGSKLEPALVEAFGNILVTILAIKAEYNTQEHLSLDKAA